MTELDSLYTLVERGSPALQEWSSDLLGQIHMGGIWKWSQPPNTPGATKLSQALQDYNRSRNFKLVSSGPRVGVIPVDLLATAERGATPDDTRPRPAGAADRQEENMAKKAKPKGKVSQLPEAPWDIARGAKGNPSRTTVRVRCKSDDSVREVPRLSWSGIGYTYCGTGQHRLDYGPAAKQQED